LPGTFRPVNVTRGELQYLARLFPHPRPLPDWSTIDRASMLGIPLVVVDHVDDQRTLAERLTEAYQP
jgi:hypothetical protein